MNSSYYLRIISPREYSYSVSEETTCASPQNKSKKIEGTWPTNNATTLAFTCPLPPQQSCNPPCIQKGLGRQRTGALELPYGSELELGFEVLLDEEHGQIAEGYQLRSFEKL